MIAALMDEHGYNLLREGNHHVWSNGKHRIVTAKSASDHRAFLNIRAIVRKYQREDEQHEQPERKRIPY